MSDRLYLSCWVRGYSGATMLRHFETMLGLFPFSKLARRGALLRIYAVEHAEPALAEHDFLPGATPAEIVAAADEFAHPDCSVEVEAEWDLWQYGDKGWELRPAPVRLVCFGPDFDNENADHLRLELGLDALYLPQEGIEGTLRMSQSNLKSLLHLVREIERAVPLERRQLWSESGVNFPALLAETLARMEAN
jgi:hypothetical protein